MEGSWMSVKVSGMGMGVEHSGLCVPVSGIGLGVR